MDCVVSVIVPVYNVEKYLEDCLASIAKQSYQNLQVILVDDGSIDGSPFICDRYAELDRRISVYHNNNRGPSFSRNFGIEHSRGKYLTFIDSDDWVDENYVANLVRSLEETGSDLAISPYYFEYPDRSVIDGVDKKQLTGILSKDLVKLYRVICGPCCKLYRKDIVCNMGLQFPLGRSYSEDRVFNYKYLQNIKKYAYVDIPQYHYRQSGFASLSKQKSIKAFADAMYALEEEKNFLHAMNAERKSEMLYWSALSYLAAFSETKETGDSYEAFYKRFYMVKKIVPVVYSLKSLKTTVASCAYMLGFPSIFYIWERMKRYS